MKRYIFLLIFLLISTLGYSQFHIGTVTLKDSSGYLVISKPVKVNNVWNWLPFQSLDTSQLGKGLKYTGGKLNLLLGSGLGFSGDTLVYNGNSVIKIDGTNLIYDNSTGVYMVNPSLTLDSISIGNTKLTSGNGALTFDSDSLVVGNFVIGGGNVNGRRIQNQGLYGEWDCSHMAFIVNGDISIEDTSGLYGFKGQYIEVSSLRIGSTDINTKGVLTNVAYKDSTNTFTGTNTFNRICIGTASQSLHTLALGGIDSLTGLNIVRTDKNLNRTTLSQATDTSSFSIRSTTTGKYNMVYNNNDGTNIFKLDSAGNMYIAGELKCGIFVHAVGVTDTCNYVPPTITQWEYQKIETHKTTGGIRWSEVDGLTCKGDSIGILTPGDYKIDFSITLSGTNANDFWRVKIRKNGADFNPPLGRFRFRTTANNQSDTRSYFWYVEGLIAGDYLSFYITNESASRDPTIVDMKVYVEKKPE